LSKYILVTSVNADGEEYKWTLVDDEGTILKEYDEKPAHPGDTIDAILDDIGLTKPVADGLKFVINSEWDIRTEYD